MNKLLISILLITFIILGCAVGFVNKETTLMEPPFAVETMRGSVTDATRCVGRYWQKIAVQYGQGWWSVQTESFQVLISGVHLGSGAPPISLVIDFEEVDGKTIARAHMHRIFNKRDKRRDVTIEALNACRLENDAEIATNYYEGIKGIVLQNGEVILGKILGITTVPTFS